MSSKNNPLNRGRGSNDKFVDGKKVIPVLFIGGKNRYIAAAFEDGKLVIDSRTQMPVAFQAV